MIRFVWKVFLLSLFPMMLQVTRKRNSKKIVLFKKLLINKAERFLKSQFNLNLEYAKYCLYKIFKFGTSTQMTCLIFLLKIGEMLGWDMIKNMFAQTTLVKVFGTTYRNPVKLGRARKLRYLLLRGLFGWYCHSFISRRKIRH